ncbi:signal recognition particle-docking protein FtsY [Pseudonocardia nantongensis]|uniref:signal recognition particle-docking protein FtsY n=1 Tax=Pseudonocardia nantongensis TaxID=1181885 RepID=UPI00397D3244
MSTQTLWIIVAVVVAVLLIALVAGLVITRRRRISLREDERQRELEQTEQPPRGGGYQAGGGFAFSSGTATAPERPASGDAPETIPPAPDTPASDTRARDTRAPDTRAPAAGEGETTPTADDVRTPPGGTPVLGGATEARTPPGGIPVSTAPPVRSGEVPSSPVIDTAEASKDPDTRQLARPGTAPADPDATGRLRTTGATDTSTAPDTASTDTPPTGTAATGTAATDTRTSGAGAAATAGTAAPTRPADTAPAEAPTGAPTEQTPTEQAPADATAPVAPGAPTEEIAPAEGRLGRLRGRLSRSRSGLGQSLLGLLGAGDLDEESWEDVEATLLQADLGPEMTAEITEKLREQLASRGVRSAEGVRQTLHDVLTEALDTDQDRSVHALPHDDGRPAVLLVVGVNGTGKTTTTGKLARVLVAGGRTVTLGAADTFRAAAAEQLVTWGERSGAGVVRGPEGADPASVAFDAVKRGTADGVDAVLLDTAGRLHTKTGLMDELGKVKRVVEKQAEVDEVLLVLDATTGQNGLTQARVFGEVVDVTGIALTKLDGTAKGGIVFRVQRELGVPVKLVGLGEGPDDLAPFEPKAFVDALLT